METNKWLKKLQQESWELELLVSGFSILLLAKGIEVLSNVQQELLYTMDFDLKLPNIIVLFLAVVILAGRALIINLIIHLVFRGFWVGIVGLGSVAPEANFEKLKYSQFFTDKLKKHVSNIDDLVIMVDKISSVVFAFAFLVIFLLISVALVFILLVVVGSVGSTLVDITTGWINQVLTIFLLFLIFGIGGFGLIYLFDFITFGSVKKIRFFSRIYYPLYKFYGWVTLAFIYRTIYYNLISKFTKKRMALVLLPYLLILILVPGFKMDYFQYFPNKAGTLLMHESYYEDQRDKDLFAKVVIPSMIIHGNSVPLFIGYDPNDNKVIRKLSPEYKPIKKEGLNSGFALRRKGGQILLVTSNENGEPFPDKSLMSLAGIYKIKIDSVLIEPNKFFFKEMGKIKGIFTVLDINALSKGYHEIRIDKFQLNQNDSLYLKTDFANVPFWKE